MRDQTIELENDKAVTSQNLMLNEKEQNLRIEELELKIVALKKPEYKKIGTWTGVVAIAVAVTGIVAQGVLYKIESANAEKNLTEANQKVETANKKVLSLNADIRSLEETKKVALIELEQITDKISNLQTGHDPNLILIKEDINAAAINLRASTTPAQQQEISRKSLHTAIEELFSPKASTRGIAYNIIMTFYSGSPELIPALLDYANKNLDNQNGIYNTLVVLGHLSYDKTTTDFAAIRDFAEKTKNNGPKTADRVKKVLERLPD